MKIVHVAPHVRPGSFVGGIAKMVYELALAQASLGHQVEILTAIAPDGSTPASQDTGVFLHSFPITSRATSASLLATLRQRAASVDVVHGHSIFLPLNRYVRAASRRATARAFFHVHGAFDHSRIRSTLVKRIKKAVYIRLVERPILNAAAAVFALTHEEQAQIAAAGVTAPIVVLPNGIVPVRRATASEVRQFRALHHIPSEAPVIVSLTRIDPKKAIDILVEAFAQLPQRRPQPILVIAGDLLTNPAYVANVQELAARRGVQERVVWTGHLSEEQKVAALGSATICSHVSHSEGMALSILESMSAGVVTIISDACNMGEAAAAGAVAVSLCVAEELANSMARLLQSEEERQEIARKAARYAATHHDWSRIAKQSIDIYRSFGGHRDAVH